MTVQSKESLLVCPDCTVDDVAQPLSQFGICVRCNGRFPSIVAKASEPHFNLNTKDRAEMRMSLRQHMMDTPCRGFKFGIIKNCVFGIIDRDRADFLGLKFGVDYIVEGGTTDQHIPTEESLRLLKKFGKAEALNGMYCWMFSEGSGCSAQRFVCLSAEVYGDEF